MDYKITPLYRVFEECERLATQFGVRVTGSELVGMIPLEAMLDVGRHYLQKLGSPTSVSEGEMVRIAAQSLGMGEISDFKQDDRIIEYKLRKTEKG